MTRDRIVQLLDLVVLELANNTPPPKVTPTVAEAMQGLPGINEAEWAYVKGLASHAVLRLRHELTGAGPR